MKADPTAQLRLLDLQTADSALARLTHRRGTLPQLAELATLGTRLGERAVRVVELETALSDIDGEQRRLENDVDGVRARAGRDEQRLAGGGLPSKELANLQHEVTSLARRQSALEDDLLEVMERREQTESELQAARAQRGTDEAERVELEAQRDAQFADIDRDRAMLTGERTVIAGELPADLVGQYDKIRAANGGIGAAALLRRRCEGCRLELAGTELAAARNAAPDEVLRCENCRRILVRTAESGL